MAPRKRSVVWSFFRVLNEKKVHCLLCMEIVFHNGHTTNMLKHMRTKHPAEFRSAEANDRRGAETGGDNVSLPMITNSRDEYSSVEVTMEGDDDHPVQITTVNEADLTSAINGILKAAENQVVEGQSEVTSEEMQEGIGSGPGTSTRKWSSVWTHYERLEDQKRALCLLCMEKIQHHSSTSNLHRHLSKKHPEAFARMEGHNKKRLSKGALGTPSKDDTLKPTTKIQRYPEVFDVMGACEGEVRMLERERELTEALRKAQQQEARALEQQRELLEALRRANAREASAEKEVLEGVRRAQEQEARALRREREEAQRERAELLVERERLRVEREALECLRREVGEGRGEVMVEVQEQS